MKPRINLLQTWLLCLAALGLCSGLSVSGQTFTTLKSFGVTSNVTGYAPSSELVQGPDGMLYGTTGGGEAPIQGTIFKLRPDGSGFTVLNWFTNAADGRNPSGSLLLLGEILFGTTAAGGTRGDGTLFRIKTDGTGFTVLRRFNANDGAFRMEHWQPPATCFTGRPVKVGWSQEFRALILDREIFSE